MTGISSSIDVTIVFGIFLLNAIITTILCCFIILLIFFTKTLHSPANILICDTCLATTLYIIIVTIQLSRLYMQFNLNDWSCRILAYFDYLTLNMLTYSYAIQALLRLVLIVFTRRRCVLHYKPHIIFMICQVLVSFVVPLSSLITKDITFRSLFTCTIPSTNIVHISYCLISSYFVPLFIVISIYVIISYRAVRSSIVVRHSSHVTKRDLELMRNILILFLIFLLAGIPSVIYTVITFKIDITSKALYILPVMLASFAVVIEKIYLILLNHEIRKETKKFFDKLQRTHTIIHPITSFNNQPIQSNMS